MTIIRSNNFDSNVAAGTTIDSVNSAVGGDAFNTIDGAPKYTAKRLRGTMALDCTGNAAPAFVTWSGMSTKTFAFRGSVLIEAAPSATGQAFTARNSSNYVLGLNLTTARKLAVTHWGGAAQYTTTTVLALDTWYRWELWGEVVGVGTGIVHFALFAGNSTTPLETWDSTTMDMQSTAITQARTGKHATSGTMSWLVDDFAMGDTAVALGPAANVAPTVSVNANQNVSSGATANLTSTASDPDGTIVSRQWSFDYPTSGTPTITGATSANASFVATAPLYILRHTVTDDGGATSYATTEVRVPTAGSIRTLPLDGTGVGSWTRAGGSASDGAALADESDATYLQSPVSSATAATRRFRLAPTAPRSAANLKVRVSQDASGSATTAIRLYEGNTLRQSWTVPTTTAVVEQTLALSSATLSAISDWGNLYIEMSVVS